MPGYAPSRCCTSSLSVAPWPFTVSTSPVSPRSGVGIFTRTATLVSLSAFDYVTERRVDSHALFLRPADAALDLVGIAFELEHDPTDRIVDVRHTNVRHHVELVSEEVHERLLDEIRLEREPHAL